MFPIRDDNPHILTPFATYGIVALNAAAWLFLQGAGSEPGLTASVCNLGLIPGEVLGTVPPGTGIEMGPGAVCVIDETGSWHTALTSMFMHGSWFHILGNMWFLWIFGNNVEDSMGHMRFVVFYLLCGLAAAALQVATNTESAIPMVGASGAIGGVMGAYVLLYPRVHVHMLVVLGFYINTIAVPAMLMLGYWLLIQFIGGLGSIGAEGGGVAFWAHVGGFLAGAILVQLFKNRELVAKHPYGGWRRGSSPTRNWQRVR
jgi:membrane associated rhomboid family serine protease